MGSGNLNNSGYAITRCDGNEISGRRTNLSSRADRIVLTGPRKLKSCVRQWLGLSGLAKIAKRPSAERVFKSRIAGEKV